MKRSKYVLNVVLLILGVIVSAQAQQVTAVRAGKLFDPKSGANLPNQVVLITGDKITDVGPADRVKIPAGAKVIDLSAATVLPGLIDGHVHLTDGQGNLQHQMMIALNTSTRSLNAGYTTLVAMGSHGGGYADVELKKAIESGLVQGPRLITAGPIINVTMPGSASYPLDFAPHEPDITANGPNALRAAVRELAHYGVDHVKIHTTGPFYFDKDGKMFNQPLPTRTNLPPSRMRPTSAACGSPPIPMGVTGSSTRSKSGSTIFSTPPPPPMTTLNNSSRIICPSRRLFWITVRTNRGT